MRYGTVEPVARDQILRRDANGDTLCERERNEIQRIRVTNYYLLSRTETGQRSTISSISWWYSTVHTWALSYNVVSYNRISRKPIEQEGTKRTTTHIWNINPDSTRDKTVIHLKIEWTKISSSSCNSSSCSCGGTHTEVTSRWAETTTNLAVKVCTECHDYPIDRSIAMASNKVDASDPTPNARNKRSAQSHTSDRWTS